MNLESIKNMLDNLNIELKQIDAEQKMLIVKQCDNRLIFAKNEDHERYCYLAGKYDLLRQLSETITDMYFDSEGDLAYIKDTYSDKYIYFLEGVTDAFKGISNYITK